MGRRRAAVIGRGRRAGGGVPFMVALIGGPLLILASLFGSPTPPPSPARPAPVASAGVTTSYVSLAAQPQAAQAPTVALALADPPQVSKQPAPAPVERITGRTQYVAGQTVALRADPKAKAVILDRYESGQAVEVLGRSGEWTHVRHALTQRGGWVQAKRLRDEPPAADVEAKPDAPQAKVSPTLSAAAIAKLLIEQSIAEYPGPCACPYQSARNGSSCGKRAAYVRPGGYAPLCYAKDVTPEMIAAYRAEH